VQTLARKRKKRRLKVKWGRVVVAFLILMIFCVGLIQTMHYVNDTFQALQPPQKTAEAVEDPFQGEEKQLEEPINVLLLGSDSRGEDQARTDTIMVAHYNPQTGEAKLISLMRDMFVTVPEYGQQKLNSSFAYGGPELLRKTIKENFDLDLHYYAIIDFKGFEKAVDLLVPEGIEVDIPYEMSDGIGMTLEEGTQQLHGKELLGYVRFRQDRLSDFGRVERQQEVIGKLKEEAVGLHSVVKLPELLDIFNTYVDTNIETTTLLSVGKNILTNNNSKIETLRIPKNGTFENQRHETLGEGLEVDFYQNTETLKQFLEEQEEEEG